MDNIRKLIVGGTGVAAAVLMATSTAYACTVYKGKMTVTVAPGFGVSTVVGLGNFQGQNSNHQYCPGKGPSGVIATAMKNPGLIVVTINVAPTTECANGTTPNMLSPGMYDIDFRNNAGTVDAAYTGSYTTASWTSAGANATNTTTSCGPGRINDPGFHRIGSMQVFAGGSGAAEVILPQIWPTENLRTSTKNALDQPTDASALCVNAQLNQGINGEGNQVPLAVL